MRRVRKGRVVAEVLTVLLVVGLGFAATARAETTVDVSAQVRARGEFDKREFISDAAKMEYTDLRSRVGIGAEMEANTRLFVQFQDSRRLGGTNSSGSPVSGTLNDGKNVDVHQAFVKIKELWKGGLGIQAGRFEVNLGNQRVFGGVGWSNVGRSWEGAKAWCSGKNHTLAAYRLKALERNDPRNNQDIDIVGLTADLPRTGLELFAFWEHDAEQEIDAFNRLDRYDLGAYFNRSGDAFDVEANGVLQLGVRGLGTPPMSDQDISAFLLTAEAGYTFPGKGKGRVAAGVDFASGDDDPADDTFKAYDNLYYTGHKFRGYMDYFLSSNSDGLIDLMLRGRVDPAPGWTLKSDIHLFSTAQDYTDFNGEETKSVGIEVDLSVGTSRVKGAKLEGGASFFLPSGSFAGTEDKDPGVWLYSMITAGFDEKVK